MQQAKKSMAQSAKQSESARYRKLGKPDELTLHKK